MTFIDFFQVNDFDRFYRFLMTFAELINLSITFIEFILKDFYRVYNLSMTFIDFILKDFYIIYEFVNDFYKLL